MIKVFLLVIFVFVGSIEAFGVYSPEAYGEKNFSEYYGSRDLMYRVDEHSGRVIFEEKEILKFYPENLIQEDLKFFSFFFFNELSHSLSCPQSELGKFYDYFQFSNRVLTLSYLYENIRARENKAKRLSDKKTCSVNWKSVLKNCEAKSNDMKFFIRSASHIIKEKRQVYSSSSLSLKDQRSKWLKELKSNSSLGEASYRLKEDCSGGKCRSLTFKGSMSKLDRTCREDLSLFESICSEEDQIYGLGYVSESYPLLINSDILDVADEDGFAAGCLRKFKQRTISKEIVYNNLKLIFPATYNQMNKEGRRYIQGDLFPAGSMKKFIDMGLVDLFQQKKEKVLKKKVRASKKKTYDSPIEDKVEFIDRFVKKKRKKKKLSKRVLRKVKKKKHIKKSSFLIAVDLRNQLDSDEVRVDMNRFKYDFLFSMNLKKVLDDNLGSYTSRAGISDMKAKDKLGTKKGPMPLMFLKYLIETDKHQSLFSLLSIVGDKFYVQNDIDTMAKDSYNYIELANNEATNHKWQIIIIKP
jgi:hypothetical protein